MRILKLIFCLLIICFLLTCQNKKDGENRKYIIQDCNSNIIKLYDSLFVVMSDRYIPTDLNLDKSIKADIDVNKFITAVKKNDECININLSSRMNEFIITIMLKQYKYHLMNFHQGFDLLSMDNANGKYLVEKYLLMLGKNKSSLEMLNSGYIVDFLNSSRKIQLTDTQEKLLEDINALIIKQEKELK